MSEKRKAYVGEVIQDKADKTVLVSIQRMVKEPHFKKYLRRSTTFMAHDETNACHIGDIVNLIETRPISARKRWKVLDILKKKIEI
jgi:small subunit ribosomal protein S17